MAPDEVALEPTVVGVSWRRLSDEESVPDNRQPLASDKEGCENVGATANESGSRTRLPLE